MDLRAYLDAAKRLRGITSDSRLARELGVTPAHVSDLYAGKRFPSDELMLKIAAAAGAPPDIALLELNAWRTRGPCHELYAAMLRRLAAAVVIGATVAGPLAFSRDCRSLYILVNHRRRLIATKARFLGLPVAARPEAAHARR